MWGGGREIAVLEKTTLRILCLVLSYVSKEDQFKLRTGITAKMIAGIKLEVIRSLFSFREEKYF